MLLTMLFHAYAVRFGDTLHSLVVNVRDATVMRLSRPSLSRLTGICKDSKCWAVMAIGLIYFIITLEHDAIGYQKHDFLAPALRQR